MKRRILSIVLCLAMLMSYAVPVANATGSTGDIYMSDNSIVYSDPELETPNTVLDSATAQTVDTSVPTLMYAKPECSCANGATTITGHVDTCDLKVYFNDLCQDTAEAIFARWTYLTTDEQDYIKTYVAANKAATSTALLKLVNSIVEVNKTVGNVTVSNFPSNGTLNVVAGDSTIVTDIDDRTEVLSAADQEDFTYTKQFAYTITATDVDGNTWEPDKEVTVTVTIPDVTLHKYTQVFVGTKDPEMVMYRPTTVVDGKITFETNNVNGTFVGYIKTYELPANPKYPLVEHSVYDDASVGTGAFSLSYILEKFKMPYNEANVTSVTSSYTSYVSVSGSQSAGWKIAVPGYNNSSFTDGVYLTINTDDNKSYKIEMTFNTNVQGANNNGTVVYEDDSNNVWTWEVDSDGICWSGSPKYHATSTIYVKGEGKHNIVLQGERYGGISSDSVNSNLVYVGDTATVYLKQLQILDGADVEIRIGSNWPSNIKKVQIVCSDTYAGTNQGYAMFYIVDGSLTLIGKPGIELVISGNDDTKFINNSLVYMEKDCTGLYAINTRFQRAGMRAICCFSDEADITLENCYFSNTVYCTQGCDGNWNDGGAIYINEGVTQYRQNNLPDFATTGTIPYVDINNLIIKNCTFAGTSTAGNGGAIASAGKVRNCEITGTTFQGAKTKNYTNASGAVDYGNDGGALFFSGPVGNMLIKGCTFDDCVATENGGAISTRTVRMTKSGSAGTSWSRINDLDIVDCTFTGCMSLSQHGGAISVRSELGSLSIRGCTFTDCQSGNNGGAISFGGGALASTVSWTSQMGQTTYGSDLIDKYEWPGTSTIYCTTNYVDVCDSTFTNCHARSGGAIEMRDSLYISDRFALNNCVFDGSKCRFEGNTIFYSNNIVKESHMNGCVFKNGDYMRFDLTKGTAGSPTTTTGTVANGSPAAGTLNDWTSSDSLTVTWNTTGTQVTSVARSAIKLVKETTVSGTTYTTKTTSYTYPEIVNPTASDTWAPDGSAGGTVRTTGNSSTHLVMRNCALYDNYSKDNGAGLYWNAANDRSGAFNVTAQVYYSYFYKNNCSRDGAGIYCEADLSVIGSTFEANSATRGGGIAQQVYNNAVRPVEPGESTILALDANTRVFLNTASNSGGGLSLRANPSAAIADIDAIGGYTVAFSLGGAYVYNNTAVNDGGGVYFKADYDSANPTEANIYKVDSYTKTITLNTGLVYGNTAGRNGGGVYMEANAASEEKANTSLTISGAKVFKNTASSNGGGIYLDGTFAKCYVTGGVVGGSEDLKNTATNNGGGIAIYGGSYMEMTGGVISYNAADVGGGIAVREASTMKSLLDPVTKTGGVVSYNTATQSGGGILVADASKMNVEEGTVSYNESQYGGGIGLLSGSEMTLDGGHVLNNEASGYGGGINLSGASKITINSGDVMYNNKAGYEAGTITYNTGHRGGGIAVCEGSSAYIYGGNIDGNYSTKGGGIMIRGNSYVEMNAADDGTVGHIGSNMGLHSGGGIYLSSAASTSVDNVIVINGGIIENNAATFGGGARIESNNSFTLNGGKINSNVGTSNGGGLYGNGATITIDKGEVNENRSQYGAGLFTELCTVNINGGTINENIGAALSGSGFVYTENLTKESQGAGLFLRSTTATLEDGCTIQDNVNKSTDEKAWGGGFMIDGDSTVTINGGSIHSNEARNGAGLYIKDITIYASANGDSAPVVTMYGGSITDNIATINGGGFALVGSYADFPAKFDVYGGTISGNTAENGAGGYVSAQNTAGSAFVNLYGGTIEANDASKAGGGVCAIQQADVNIEVYTDPTTNKTSIPVVNKNEASLGGGIYVDSGADLVINGGYVTYNNAVDSCSLTTANKQSSSLAGTGGGIYVADGNSDTVPSTFKLEGEEMAIYGNLADFAADDVFANAVNTKLVIPTVYNMSLGGYGYPVGGWFADYPINDTEYAEGVNTDGTQNITNGSNVYRYKTSPSAYRYEVRTYTNSDGVVELVANKANEYVCMTLGVPSALADTVVVDFGLPVKIDVLNNDLVINPSNSTLAGLGAARPVLTDPNDIDYSTSKDSNYDSTGSKLTGCPGTVSVSGQYVIYTPNTTNISEAYTFGYAANYTPVINGVTADKGQYYANITIVPATTIYYEDSFLTTTDSTATSSTDSSFGKWVVDDNNEAYQDADRPGLDIDDMLGDLDVDNIYGYDGAYVNKSVNSLGGYLKVTVDATTGKQNTAPKAIFTFTGTGFDVISRTDSDCGAIWVTVTKNGETTATKSYVVNTHYGYSYDPTTGKWTASTDSAKLYQVPIIKVDGLDYGTYNVELKPIYLNSMDVQKDGSYSVWLDAIRIYNPALNDETSNSVYEQDGEHNPWFTTVKSLLTSPITESNDSTGGFGFIDGMGTTSVSMIDYANQGPNNETYLKDGNGIGFKLLSNAENEPDISLQIGAKLVYGSSAHIVYNGTTLQTITSKTAMFYKLPDLTWTKVTVDGVSHWESSVIAISCADSTGASILSLTDIKVTGDDAASIAASTSDNPTDGTTISAVVDKEVLDAVSAASTTVKAEYGSISLLGEVVVNFYFSVSGPNTYSVEDMGLLTWSSQPTAADATYANAMTNGKVMAGAFYSAANGMYWAETDGISAKNLGDDIYMRAYVKVGENTYAYSQLIKYSPKLYAEDRLANSTNAEMKALAVAMLNYGAAAQTYFGYKTGSLMNAGLTAAQKTLVTTYDASTMATSLSTTQSGILTGAKVGQLTASATGFTKKYPTVSFAGEFSINYHFTPQYDVPGYMYLYVWSAEDFNNLDVLTLDNATDLIYMTRQSDGSFLADVSGITAQHIDDVVYVCGLYNYDGNTYCTGVIPYSVTSYCADRIANGTTTGMKDLARATAVYGYYAKEYFN